MLRPMATGTGGVGNVLVVEADPAERGRYGAWLETAGFEVLVCPGPMEPDYTCLGSRGRTCPLASEAALIVLDMSLASEGVVMGTPAEELLGLYLVAGHRVVVLGSHPGEELPGQLRRLRRHPERAQLVDAVRSLAEHHPAPGTFA
jgi:hypothetical protein